LPGIYSEEEVVEILDYCLDYYQDHCASGERFGEILEREGIEDFWEDLGEASKKK